MAGDSMRCSLRTGKGVWKGHTSVLKSRPRSGPSHFSDFNHTAVPGGKGAQDLFREAPLAAGSWKEEGQSRGGLRQQGMGQGRPMPFHRAVHGYFDVRRESYSDKESLSFMIHTLKSTLKERFQFVEIPGNHYVHMSEPQHVASIISSFLQRKHTLTA
ncbi:hypothetical protein H8959_006952 [Pygathrix nigripes]